MRELLKCGKALSSDALELLEAQYEQARRRAEALDAKHHQDGSPPFSNPSTNMWHLIDSIKAQQPEP